MPPRGALQTVTRFVRRARNVALWLLLAAAAAPLTAETAPPSAEASGFHLRGVSLGVVPLRTFDREALLTAAIDPEFQQTGTDQATAPAGIAPPEKKRFWLAAGEIALTEALPWVYNRYIAKEDFARISWQTVEANYKAGFGFDEDHFSTNQSAHPFHGSLYFNAGRSNGYDYWESALFTAMGSVIWEMTMENTQPSINDLVNTTLGGMTRGEV